MWRRDRCRRCGVEVPPYRFSCLQFRSVSWHCSGKLDEQSTCSKNLQLSAKDVIFVERPLRPPGRSCVLINVLISALYDSINCLFVCLRTSFLTFLFSYTFFLTYLLPYLFTYWLSYLLPRSPSRIDPCRFQAASSLTTFRRELKTFLLFFTRVFRTTSRQFTVSSYFLCRYLIDCVKCPCSVLRDSVT